MKFKITTSISPPGYREPDVKKTLELDRKYIPVMCFYGDCFGVALVKTKDSNHLTFIVLVENDGWWFSSNVISVDSCWLPELLEVLKVAHQWMKDNCKKSEHGGFESKK